MQCPTSHRGLQLLSGLNCSSLGHASPCSSLTLWDRQAEAALTEMPLKLNSDQSGMSTVQSLPSGSATGRNWVAQTG